VRLHPGEERDRELRKDTARLTGNRLLELVTGNQNPRDAHLSMRGIPGVQVTSNQFQ